MKIFVSAIYVLFLVAIPDQSQQPNSVSDQPTQVENLQLEKSNLYQDVAVNTPMRTAAPIKSNKNISDKKETSTQSLNNNNTSTEKFERYQWNIKDIIIGALLFSWIGYFIFNQKKVEKINAENNQLTLNLIDSKEENDALINNNQQLESELAQLKRSITSKPENVLEQKIQLPGKQKTILKLGDILYVQSQKNAISVVTNKQPIWVWETLMNFKTSLPDSEFCRAHRSYLINLNEVIAYSKKSVILSNDLELRIGQTYKAELFEKLKQRGIAN